MAESIKQLREENLRLRISLECNEKRTEDFEKRCADQQAQILRLQDALVAREAPDAYADRKVDEDISESSKEEQASAKRNNDLARVNRQMIDRIADENYFNSADEMIDILTRGAAPVFERTHQNEES